MKPVITILAFLLIVSATFAQETKKPDSKERIHTISQKFSVSKSRAQKIAEALDFNTDKLRKTQKDSTLKAGEKYARLRALTLEREDRINATLTKDELSLLNNDVLLTADQKQAKEKHINTLKQKTKVSAEGKVLKSK